MSISASISAAAVVGAVEAAAEELKEIEVCMDDGSSSSESVFGSIVAGPTDGTGSLLVLRLYAGRST